MAYAAEPGAGSEYGVGWMVPTTMARMYPQHEIYVLTRSRCREKIETAWNQMGLPNLHFLFYDIPRWLTYPNEMRSRWGEQINYTVWQLMARGYVRKMHRKLCFDIVHHLTFNQYRTPSPGFWLDIPFVMGPVGGAETIPPVLWQDLEPHTLRKERFRRRGMDLALFGWLTRRKNNRKLVLCSSQENLQRLQRYATAKCRMQKMAAIGYDEKDFAAICREVSDDKFTMIYAGKALDWKGLHLFLRAVSHAFDEDERQQLMIYLVGMRYEEEQQRVRAWAQSLGLAEHISLVPFMPRSELLRLEGRCHLQVYPAFRDSGSMSVLEGCAMACPTICLDAGGQDAFDEGTVIKVKVGKSYTETVENFARQLRWAFEDRERLEELGRNARRRVGQYLTWQRKVHQFFEIYEQIIAEGQ